MNRLPPPIVVGIEATQTSFRTYQAAAFGDRAPGFFALELCGECGELANLEKKAWRDPQRPVDMVHLADEAADVLISLLNYCNTRGIDLQNAANRKLAEIEERRLAGRMGPVRDRSKDASQEVP